MEKIKVLLCCNKQKPYLFDHFKTKFFTNKKEIYANGKALSLNGKIVAECDYEVEEIAIHRTDVGVGFDTTYYTEKMEDDELIQLSCVDNQEMQNYFGISKNNGEIVGNAIHIKNLHIFDKAREVNEYLGAIKKDSVFYPLQNCSSMMRVYQRKDLNNIDYNNFDWELLDKTNIEDVNKYIVISVSSQEMCRICNGEQTILIRKRVLKEML